VEYEEYEVYDRYEASDTYDGEPDYDDYQEDYVSETDSDY
jgi:hypothetical protein